MYHYLEFKLPYLQNLKLFSITVKEIFESIVFFGAGGGKRQVFALFLKHFLEKLIFE